MVIRRAAPAVHASLGPIRRSSCCQRLAPAAVDWQPRDGSIESELAGVRSATRDLDKTLPCHQGKKDRARSLEHWSAGTATPNVREGRQAKERPSVPRREERMLSGNHSAALGADMSERWPG